MKLNRLIWLGICLALSACARHIVAPEKPDTFEMEIQAFKHSVAIQKYGQGLSLLREERAAEAAAMFKVAIDRDPGFAPAHNMLGEISLKQGDRDNAKLYFETAIKAQPDFLQAYHNLGNLYNDQGKYQPAEELYRKSLKIADEQKRPFSQAHYGLGRALLGCRKPESALDEFKLAAAMEPFQAVFQKGLGDAYLSMDDNQHAIAAYEKVLQIDPQFFEVYYSLGRCYYAQGMYDRAASSYWQAIRYKYNNAQLQEYLGLAYLAQNNYGLAASTFKQALELDPKYANAWYRLGQTYAKQGDLQVAAQAFKKALELQPGHIPAWLELGDVYRQQDKIQDAISVYGQAAKNDPKCFEAYFSLGEVYRSLRQWDKAQAAFTQALAIDSRSAAAYYALGLCCRNQGQYANAIQAIQKALEIDPHHTAARYSLGSVYQITNEPAKAKAYQDEALLEQLNKRGVSEGDARQKTADPLFYFKLAAEIVPNDPQIYTQLGTAYMARGGYAEASQAYSKAAALDSANWEGFERWAVAASAAGQAAEAEVAYKRVVEMHPQNVDACYNLGVIYWQQGKLDDALENLQRALDMQGKGQADAGNQPDKILQTNFYLGQILLAKGVKSRRREWVEQARQYLKTCQQLDPAHTQVQALLTQAENLLENKIQIVRVQVKELKPAQELRDQFYAYGGPVQVEPLLKRYPNECQIMYASPEELGPYLWSKLQKIRDGNVSEIISYEGMYYILYRIQSL